jgi:nitrite reductase (NADH) large subunit
MLDKVVRQKLVVIGNGMASIRTLEELLARAPHLYDITVFGAEPYGNYNRILLSPVLAGEKTVPEIMLNDQAWYDDNGITLYKGKTITKIDRARRQVAANDGTVVPYDRLLIATGSLPFMLPIPGAKFDGVVAFRDIKDVDTMLAAAKTYKRAVVIGGGLRGLEAASGLMKNGMDVTVIHLMTTLMERQLDAEAGEMLRQSLVERGLKFEMAAKTKEVIGKEGRAAAVLGILPVFRHLKHTKSREVRVESVGCVTFGSDSNREIVTRHQGPPIQEQGASNGFQGDLRSKRQL